MSTPAHFTEARKSFHAALLGAVLRIDERGVASNADRGSQASIRIARGVVNLVGEEAAGARLAGQMSGRVFEEICKRFLENTFLRLGHLRPGNWHIRRGSEAGIALHEQYAHLTALDRAASRDPELAAALGSDYIIKPDVVITRETEEDAVLNANGVLVDEEFVRYASLRKI